MKNLLFVLAGVLLLSALPSCIKPENRSTYTLKGRLMSIRYNDTLANFALVLRKNKAGYTAEKRILGNTSTDNKGIFIFEKIYVTDNSQLEFQEDYVQPFSLQSVPRNGDTVDLGEVWIRD